MVFKYAVALQGGFVIPDRHSFIEQAWGDVPVSYISGGPILDVCSFIDLKVNKWEISRRWDVKHNGKLEPMVRVNILKRKKLKRYLKSDGCLVPADLVGQRLVVLELDENERVYVDPLDEMLLLRLVSVFFGKSKIYRLGQALEEISDIDAFPTLAAVHEELFRDH